MTDIEERTLPWNQRQMIHVLIKKMLTETNPERLQMFTEQIRRIATLHYANEPSPKARRRWSS